MGDIHHLEEAFDYFIRAIQPIQQSNDLRHRIITFLREIIEKKLPHVCLIPTGSTCSRTYLADGDLDLVLISRPSQLSSAQSIPSSSSASTSASPANQELQLLTSLFSILCEEIHLKESGQSKYSDFTIRNIELINARAKLVHCKVNNIGIDISFNQIGALSGLIFLEEVDHFIGNDHLFKRSLLLVKAWCMHESKKYCGYSILGSKEGMLSSYSLSIMVLYLFAKFRNSLRHPLHVLRMFLYFYQLFPWDTHVLTLEGPKFIQIGPTNHGSHKSNHHSQQNQQQAALNYEKDFACENIFASILQPLIEQFQHYQSQRILLQQQQQQQQQSGNNSIMPAPLTRFALRVVNIQDPIDKMNNLSYSVTRNSLQIITKALAIGYQNIEGLMILYLKQNVNPNGSPMTVHHPNGSSSYPSPSSSVNSNVTSPLVPERRGSKNMSLASSSNDFVNNAAQKIPPNTFPQFSTPATGYPQFSSQDLQQLPIEGYGYHLPPNEKLKRASFNWTQHPILAETFSISLSVYVHSIRADLLDHPLQQAQQRSSHSNHMTKIPPLSPSSSSANADVLVGDPSLASNFFDFIENIQLVPEAHQQKPPQTLKTSPLKEDRTIPSNNHRERTPNDDGDDDNEDENDEYDGEEDQDHEDEDNDESSLSEEEEDHPHDTSGHPLDSPIFFEKDRETSSSLAPTVSSTSTSQHDSDSPPSYTLPHAPIEIPLDLPMNIPVPTSSKKSINQEEDNDEEPKEIDPSTPPAVMKRNNLLQSSIPSQGSDFASGGNRNYSSVVSSSSTRKKRSKSITKQQQITPVLNTMTTPLKREDKENTNKKTLFSKSSASRNNNIKSSSSSSSVNLLFPDLSQQSQDSITSSSSNYSRPLFICLITTITIFSVGWVYYNLINPTDMMMSSITTSSSSSSSYASSSSSSGSSSSSVFNSIGLSAQKESIDKEFQLNPWEYTSSYLSTKHNHKQQQQQQQTSSQQKKQSAHGQPASPLLDSMIRNLIEHSSASNILPTTPVPSVEVQEGEKSEKTQVEENSSPTTSTEEDHPSSKQQQQQNPPKTTTIEEKSPVIESKAVEVDSSVEVSSSSSSSIEVLKVPPSKTMMIPAIGSHFLAKDQSVTIGDIKSIEDYVKTGKFPFIPKQYLWTRNQQNITISSFPFFTIEKMRREFVGRYACYEIVPVYADTDTDTEPPLLVSEELKLILETNVEMLMKPRIRSRPFYQEVKLGKPLILSLEVEGIPPPSFQWYRNGYPLPDQLQHTLFIREIESIHSGTYSCEVSNVAGKSLWSEVVVAVLE